MTNWRTYLTDSYPNPVRFWPIFLRQVEVVGGWPSALITLPLVIDSAKYLQQEINESRAKDRAIFERWDKMLDVAETPS